MEKMSVESAGRVWHASDTDTVLDGRDQVPDLAHMCCCPCVNYSRTNARLNAALKGNFEGVENPNRDNCTTECVQFCVCIPFYSVMVSRLQGTIRAFYDIEGKETSDWADGCFCPCATISRNEEEVVFRERNRRAKQFRILDLDDMNSDEYKSQLPMSYGSPRAVQSPEFSSPPLAKSGIFNGRESDTDMDPLTCVPEKMLARPNNVYLKPDTRKFNNSSFDYSPEIVPADKNILITSPLSPRPLMEYLGQKWYLVPADNKENDDPAQGKDQLASRDDLKQDRVDNTQPKSSFDKGNFLTVPANVLAKEKYQPTQYPPRVSLDKEKGQTAAVQSRASLEKKQKDQAVATPPRGSLEKKDQAVATPPRGSLEKKDQSTAAQPRSSLEKKDQAILAQPKRSEEKEIRQPTQGHRLSQDERHDQLAAAKIHTLDHDKQRSYNSPIVIAHMLEQERYRLNQGENSEGEPSSVRAGGPYLVEGPIRPVIEHGKSRFTEHLLEDDRYYVASPTRSGSPHYLSADAMVSRIHAMGSPHFLEDEPVAQRAVIENIDEPSTQSGLTTTSDERSSKGKGKEVVRAELAKTTSNDERSSKSKGKEVLRAEPPKQKEEPARGRTEARRGFLAFMGRHEHKAPEIEIINSTMQKAADKSPSLELNLPPEETDGIWAKGFWPGAFASSSPSGAVSHDIDDDVRVMTQPEAPSPHTIDTDEKNKAQAEAPSPHTIDTDERKKAQPEIPEPIKDRDSTADNEKPVLADIKTADNSGDKLTKTTTNNSTEATASKSAKATGSKIAKAASQLFGAGSK
ncbi:unnamed protein product [Clonostachys rosea]|uniref:Uncharacterized protein n=1 Tax=Bionectria ochroleuca TaxID=29856 RepID=A0ABY6V1C4_BIOOC|nr:unnamed protein product [Clonostachys rosea]